MQNKEKITFKLFLPDNNDLITEEEVLRVTNKLNNRPRKRFGFKSPNEIFEQKLKQCA
ncbi:hypothetical protein [Flavobacterium sp. PL002]|uniref:hypothetical protein n=1 Tax=Flavobacterium sp. PL002 TaxID=1897058 RepID=UPI00178840D8|nr:hypothetical protein [Flavobacterium sp. PL002]